MKTATLHEDIQKYQQILTKSEELEKDIPPRSVFDCQKRARVTKRKLIKLKNAPIPRPQFGGPKVINTKVKKSVVEAVKSEKVHQKRSSIRTRSRSKLAELVLETSLKSQLEAKVQVKKAPIKPLSAKAITFENKVMAGNLYSELVEKIRDASNDIDFGMLWKLLPKNIDLEKEKFNVENKEADKLLWKMLTAAFSDDIDLFFRKISGWPLDNAQSLPLV